MACLICGQKSPAVVISRRVEGLRNASSLREDGMSEMLDETAESFLAHVNCLKSYCSKDHIQRFLSKRSHDEPTSSQPYTKRLRGCSSFNFLLHCVFCGQECLIE